MNHIKQNSFKAWVKAARPVTLTGALIPVLLATALAHHNGCMQPKIAILCALFACGMQIVANMINDIVDFMKGTDREDRLGPPRACAQGWILPSTMNVGIFFTLLVCILFGVGILGCCVGHLYWGGLELVAIGGLSILFAFLYTTKLSYLGWGDVLVLVFFGIIPVAGTYYSQVVVSPIETNAITGLLPLDMWLLSLIAGIAIDALLVVNNFRDREQDKISGKRTPIARFGASFAYMQHLMITVIVASLMHYVIKRIGNNAYPAYYATALYCALQIGILFNMIRINKGKQLNALLGATSVTMTLMAILLSIAIW